MEFKPVKENVQAVYERTKKVRLERLVVANRHHKMASIMAQRCQVAVDRSLAKMIECPCDTHLLGHELANGSWAAAQTELLATRAEVRRLSKETKREFALRWAAQKVREEQRQARAEVRAERRAQKLRLKNRFWAMHRLNMVEDFDLWARPWPEPVEKRSCRSSQWRRFARSRAAKQAAKEAQEAFNPHMGKTQRVPRQKIRWEEFVQVTNWEWDRWAHTLTWKVEWTPVVTHQKLFPVFANAMRELKEKLTPPPAKTLKDGTPLLEGFKSQLDIPPEYEELLARKEWRAQMDSDAQGETEPVDIQQNQATVQIDAVGESRADAIPTPERDLAKMCGTCVPDDPLMSGREFCFASFKWKATDLQEARLFDQTLPAFVIGLHKDQPNFALFANHRYWRGDMEITARVNTNARQYGQLIMTYFHQLEMDNFAAYRMNIATMSQQTHCLMTANTSNTGTLKIPYSYPKSYLDLTMDTGNNVNGARMTQLIIAVMVPLTAILSGPQEANVSLYIKFSNSCFVATVHKTVLTPNMFTAFMAYQMLERMRGDANRDMPVVPTNPEHMKMITTHNWAAGTAQSRVAAPLRMNPHGVLPRGNTAVDEMQISFITSVFGLLKQFDWKHSDQAQTRLFVTEAAPLLDTNEYWSYQPINRMYILPPVAVISSMFRYWRGELEYRFDIIGATEITGRLMVAFVPSHRAPTFAQAMASNPLYIDVQENRSFTYVVPYKSDTPWRNRISRDGNADGSSPRMGYIGVWIINDLIPNPTVPDTCKVLVYVRGAPTFEVSVPIQPMYGLASFPQYNTGNQVGIFGWKSGYTPVYLERWRYFGTGSKYLICRYGNGTDHICQLNEATVAFLNKLKASQTKWCYFRIMNSEDETKDNLKFHASDAGKDPTWYTCLYMVPWTNDQTYWYAVPTTSQARAVKLTLAFYNGKTPDQMNGDLYQYSRENEALTVNGFSPPLELVWVDVWKVKVLAQMDERFNAPTGVVTDGFTPMSGFGQSTFGESHGDLKDLIRRTAMYMEQTPSVKTAGGVASVMVPVFPQGLDLDIGFEDSPNVVSNNMRHCVRDFIASGYRYFTGSMGLKIVSSGRGGFFVQHVPRSMESTFAKFPAITPAGTLVADEDVMHQGCAMYTLNEANSNIAEVEVPYYLPGEMGLLQSPNYSKIKLLYPDMVKFTDLGHLLIGRMYGGDTYSATYSIWANGGDDLRFFGFQGFPPMFKRQVVVPYYKQPGPPNMPPKKVSGRQVYKASGRRESVLSAVSEASSFEDLEPQMHIPIFSDLISAASSFKSAGERVDRFTAQIGEINVEQVVTETIGEAKESAGYAGYFTFLYNAVTNLVHCVLNPSWKAVSWAFTSMFQYLFSVKQVVVEKITKIFSTIFGALARPFRKTDTFVPEMDTPGTSGEYDAMGERKSFLQRHTHQLVAIFISVIMTYLGYSAWKGHHDNKFTDLMFKLMKAFTTTANGLLTFFKGTIDLFSEMFEWCVARICPSWNAVNFLASHDNDLYKWAKDVQELTDTRYRTIVLTDPVKISELYNAANEACLIQQKILKLDKKFSGPQLNIIMRLVREITKLRDYAAGLHIAPPVKLEPFVLQLAGPPKVGKSFLMDDLTIDLLYDVGYRTHGEPTYTRSPGNDYWNNLQNQPIVKYDDFLAVLEPSVSMVQISELFQLKTTCVFNPPMAAVDDKTIRYNPIIVGICSNAAFWKLPGVLDIGAVHRRRDVLAKMYLRPEYKTIEEVSAETLMNNDHLLFDLAEDPADERTTWTTGLTFKSFKKLLTQRFQAYYASETKKYKDKSERIFRLAPKEGEEAFKFANHEVGESLSKYYERQAQAPVEKDILLKTLLARFHALPSYKLARVKKEFHHLITTKGKESHDHVYDVALKAFCEVSGQSCDEVTGELRQTIRNLGCKIGTQAEKLKLVEKFFPQGNGRKTEKAQGRERRSVEGGNSDNDREKTPEELAALKQKQDDEMFELQKKEIDNIQKTLVVRIPLEDPLNKTFPIEKFHDALDTPFEELPDCSDYVRPAWRKHVCVHSFALSEIAGAATLEYDKLENTWAIPRAMVRLFGQDYEQTTLIWKKKAGYEIDSQNGSERTFCFQHAPCSLEPKCPFLEQGTRYNFVYKYIETNPQLMSAYANKEEDFESSVPAEFTAKRADPVMPTEESWKSWISGLKDKVMKGSWKTVLKCLGYFGVVVGALLGVWKFFTGGVKEVEASDDEQETDVEPQMNDASYAAMQAARRAKKGVRMGKHFGRNVQYVGGRRARPQMDLTPTVKHAMDEAWSSIVRRNTVFISAGTPGTTPIVARCLGVVDRVAIFPNHYYDVWVKLVDEFGWKMQLHDPLSPAPIPLDFDEMEFYISRNSSLAYMRMPNKLRMFRDIRSHFLSKGEAHPKRTSAVLYELNCDLKKHTFDLNKVPVTALEQARSYVDASKMFDKFVVSAGYTYGYGGAGVCGSLLITPAGKLIGMHVAGTDSGTGLSEQLGPDDVEECSNLMVFKGDVELPEEDIIEIHELKDYVPKVDTAIAVLGVVPAEVGNYAVSRSALHKSLVHDDLIAAGIECTQSPAVLNKRDPRIKGKFDPLVEGVKHHGNPMKPFPRDAVKEAVEHYTSVVLANCKPTIAPEILTLEQSIMGVPGVKYCDSVDITTSAGWPWRADTRQHAAQKQAWIALDYSGDQPKFLGLDKELADVIALKAEQREEGIVPFTVFADVLKDETLPHEKAIRPGGTRVVSMSPIDFTIQQRQYTVPFVASFMTHRLELEHAIGIDPNSEEWTRLFSRLVGQGRTHFIAADYSKFGDKLPVELGKACFDIIIKWYRQNGSSQAEKISKHLRVMAEEIFSAKHIYGKTLYQTYTGMPSGNTMTVILNSMVNSLFMRIAWVLLTEGTPYSGLDQFTECVTMYSYGDDLIVSVDKKVADIYNTVSISKCFADFDLKFTDADKEGVLRPFRTVEELVFLKRGWRRFPDKPIATRNLLLAPLEWDTVLQVPFWVEKSMLGEEGSVMMLRESLRLAFTHGPERYSYLVRMYEPLAEKLGYPLDAPSWPALAARTYINHMPLLIGHTRLLEPQKPQTYVEVTE